VVSDMSPKDHLRLLMARVWSALLARMARRHELAPGEVLIVAPHADDETLGCGGLIAARAARGLPTAVVFLTDSGGSSPEQEVRRRQACVRREEALEALRILGVEPGSVHFLDAPDGQLDRLDEQASKALQSGLEHVVRTLRPMEVYLPFLGSHSTEHQAAHAICREVLGRMSWQGDLWEYPVWAWWNPPRFANRCFGKPQPAMLALGADLGKKRAALLAHASQHASGGALPGVLARICLNRYEFFFRVQDSGVLREAA
jgi:LmbE family N-acetylglucosaminyl deacetylase